MRLALFHFLLLFSASVLATNWQKVYKNPMGDSYVDVNNLQKRKNVVYYSRLFDYTQPSPIGVNSSVSQFTVDCIGEKDCQARNASTSNADELNVLSEYFLKR